MLQMLLVAPNNPLACGHDPAKQKPSPTLSWSCAGPWCEKRKDAGPTSKIVGINFYRRREKREDAGPNSRIVCINFYRRQKMFTPVPGDMLLSLL